jgi:hypothetical protein
MNDNDYPLLNSFEAVAVIKAEIGIDVCHQRFWKRPRNGNDVPPVAAKFGKRNLYRRSEVLDWAKRLIKPATMVA